MIPLRLDFLNKNMYRKYPIRATSTYIFENGDNLPLSLITSIQITTTFAYSQVYISKVYVNNGFINITIQEAGTGTTLGCFSGQITTDQQVLTLQAFNNVTSGVITIGSIAALSTLTGMYTLSVANGMLEDSTVYCFMPPAVTSINNSGNKAIGALSLVGNNITLVEESPNITLDINDVSKITANNSFSSQYSNCATPLITQINTVFPDDNGNIDIYGITPVTIAVSSGDVILSLGSLTLADVCPEKKLLAPPDNSSDTYYTDILATPPPPPEWKTWPQFS